MNKTLFGSAKMVILLFFASAGSADDQAGVCRGLFDQYDRNRCLQEEAVAAKNGDLCLEITQNNQPWPEAQDDCFKAVALEAKDPSLCDKIADTGNKDSCFNLLAYLTKDLTICENIQSSLGRSLCSKKTLQGKDKAAAEVGRSLIEKAVKDVEP